MAIMEYRGHERVQLLQDQEDLQQWNPEHPLSTDFLITLPLAKIHWMTEEIDFMCYA